MNVDATLDLSIQFEKLAKKKKDKVKGHKWRKLPKGWKPKSRKSFWNTLGGSFRDCEKALEGKVEDTARFCGALKARETEKKKKKKKRKKKAALMDKGDWTITREYQDGKHIGWYANHPRARADQDNEPAFIDVESVLEAKEWEDLVWLIPRKLIHQMAKSGISPKSFKDADDNYVGIAGWLDEVSEKPWGEKHDADPDLGGSGSQVRSIEEVLADPDFSF